MGKRKLSEFINDATYRTQINRREGGAGSKQWPVFRCPIYLKWIGIKERAGDGALNKRAPTYRDVDCCEDWLSFMNFRKWVLNGQEWEGLSLDKDLLVFGNKIYAPEFCRFIPQVVNTCLASGRSRDNGLPLGVHYQSSSKDYRAVFHKSIGKKSYKNFKTADEAHLFWCEKKSDHLVDIITDWERQSHYDRKIASNILEVASKLRYNSKSGIETFDLFSM